MRSALGFLLTSVLAWGQYGLAIEIYMRVSATTHQNRAYPATLVRPGLKVTSFPDKSITFQNTNEKTDLQEILFRSPRLGEKIWYTILFFEGREPKTVFVPASVISLTPTIRISLPTDTSRQCGAPIFATTAEPAHAVLLGMDTCRQVKSELTFTITPAPSLMQLIPKQ